MRRVSYAIILASGPALYRFAVQLHCHRALEQFSPDDETALLLLAPQDNAHHPGQGALQHPHQIPGLEIGPGVKRLVAIHDGLDGVDSVRRHRGGAAL